MSETVELAAVPLGLRWDVPPVAWRADADGTLTITAGPRTDMFVDPQGEERPVMTAPHLLGRPDAGNGEHGGTADAEYAEPGDFTLSARVTVAFSATFDAGVLLLYAGERLWAKLCFEYSPHGRPTIVSVVTRGVSDDANAFEVDANQVWLRVARLGRAFAFHASTDGREWRLIRHFALGADAEVPAVGFEAQSPVGDGCTVRFDQIRFARERLADLRDGS